jgi:REP element-mobilizing transposase RayT
MLSTSTHVYSEIYLHLNWHTKKNTSFLKGEKEIRTHAFLKDYCERSKGIRLLGLGGTEDHVHLLIQMEPPVTLSDWVGKIKGTCSHAINEEFGRAGEKGSGGISGRPSLQWQRGFGVVSFGRHDLDGLARYVEKQKEHHGKGRVNATLERYGDFEDEEEVAYLGR